MMIIENEKRKKVLGPCQRTKKVMEQKSDCDTNNNWNSQNGHQRLGKGSEKTRNQSMCQDHPNCNISKIEKNTLKS